MRIEVDTSNATLIEFRALAAMMTVLANNSHDVIKPDPSGGVFTPTEGFDMATSHEPIDTNPAKVTVYTSKNGEPYVGEYLNTADIRAKVETVIVEPKLGGDDFAVNGSVKPGDVTVDVNEGLGLVATLPPGCSEEPKLFKPGKDVDNTLDKVKKGLEKIKKAEAAKAKKAAKVGKTLAKAKEEFADAKAEGEKPSTKSVVDKVLGIEPEAPLDGSPLITTALQGEIRKLNLKCAKYGHAEDAKLIVREAVGGPCKLSEIPLKEAAGIITKLSEIAKGAEDNG